MSSRSCASLVKRRMIKEDDYFAVEDPAVIEGFWRGTKK